jgi:hypothetical protein
VDAVSDPSDNIDVDLPDDAFLSERESNLLLNLNRKIDNVTYESCDVCVEDGFNLSVVGGQCSRCGSDRGEPVRKWSAENNIHPGMPVLLR